MESLTLLLKKLAVGDEAAIESLLSQAYGELRQLAASKLAWEQAQSLAPTALVHEAYLRLFGGAAPNFESRRHFFAAASEAMRRVLVDRARRRRAAKRGGQRQRLELEPDQFPLAAADERLLAVDEALERLREADSQAAELVMLRYFSGLTLAEAAGVLQISPRSADRLWAFAKSWLFSQIENS
ncbi:MAG: sigma-70 family RNA polymerase sigma factor [Planctomycetales bacterium]|nr:sigma-70 family RNA polymerase sigma factor [Planctomycetales bacterium]